MKKQETLNQIQEILAVGSPNSLDLESFSSSLLKLDKKQLLIEQSSETGLSIYSCLDDQQRKAKHSDEFIKAISDLYAALNEYVNSSIELSKCLYRIYKITGASYNEISQVISSAYKKKLSKSYISKLIRSGDLLIQIPDLEKVTDIEKLSTLSSVDIKELKNQISIENDCIYYDDLNLVNSSRSSINSKIKNKVVNKPNSTLKVIPSLVVDNDGDRLEHLQSILESYLEETKSLTELHTSLVEALEILKARGSNE